MTPIATLPAAGGIFGGILQGVGGLVSLGVKGLFAANPLLGTVLSVGGGLVSALSSHQQEPIAVHDAALTSAIQDQAERPLYVHMTILDQYGRPVREQQEQLNRQARYNPVVRFNGGNVAVKTG